MKGLEGTGQSNSAVLGSLISQTFGRFFKAVSLFAFSTHLPYNALRAELAIGAGIGTRLAVFKACLAVADLHLLACYI